MSKKLLYYKTVDMASIKPSYKGSLDGFKEDYAEDDLFCQPFQNSQPFHFVLFFSVYTFIMSFVF